MAIVGQALYALNVWNYGGLNVDTVTIPIEYAGDITVQCSITNADIDDTPGMARAGIDRVRWNDGSVKDYFPFASVMILSNVRRIRLRAEVLNGAVWSSVVVHFWG